MHQIPRPITLDPTIFRAYDIRGIVGESLNEDILYVLGLALGSQALELKQKAVVVGRDGRLSGPSLAKALVEGLVDTGLHVIDIGLVATPVLYFATHHFQTHSGVMLTGSHNPANYNGVKIVLDKKTLMDGMIKNLYHRIQNQDFSFGKGSLEQKSIIDAYIERVCRDIKLDKRLKVVIDAGSGATGAIAPQLFKALGCEVIPLFCEVDGNFPHHHPDPSDAENLKSLVAAVLSENADIGFAFDGDGDRLGVITNQGKNIYPDRQLMCFAQSVLSNHPKGKIVFDVKCTKHLETVIQQHGGIACWSKTGHSFIKAKISEENALLGGEMSGHIFFNDKWYGFDDGMYTAARLAEILSQQNLSSDDFFAQFPDSVNTPELKIPIKETEKFQFMEKFIQQANFADGRLNTLDGLRVEFDHGWGLIRPSNTGAYLVLRFEANNEECLAQIQSLFRSELLRLNSTLELPF